MRIALLHALAHIEFVAIDLAVDLIGRFGSEFPREFVDDWIGVAADEVQAGTSGGVEGSHLGGDRRRGPEDEHVHGQNPIRRITKRGSQRITSITRAQGAGA